MDGFSAAWVAHKKFGKKATYFPAVHQTPYPASVKGNEVYMVDICYPEEVMRKMKRDASRVVVIDHHISQKKAVKISDDRLFDIKHSGSVLAWKYFFPKKKVPKLLQYVEDVDIWKLSMPRTKEMAAALDSVKFSFKNWDKLYSELETARGRKKHLDKGKAVMDFMNNMIDDIVSGAEEVKIGSHKAFAVNSPVLVSDVGHILATKAKGVGIIWVKKSDRLKVSLRSTGKVDVSKIAQRYGGGGHKAAAAFSLPLKKDGGITFPWK
ncbi:MAG: DHHA1 domain-containing protein [Candidatus Colwellbacteria bacterium]|nr:DHHA1 domain-containing protein [Candidatus Colwellbacteria bacterium]